MFSETTVSIRRWLAGARARLIPASRRGQRGRSLVSRLFMALIVSAVLVYVAAVAGLWWTGGRLIEDSARKQAVQWLTELDEQGTPLYASRGRAHALASLAVRLKNFPEIAYVRYYDASGEVLGEYRKGERKFRLPPLQAPFPTPESAGTQPYSLADIGAGRIRVTAPVLIRALPADTLLDLTRAAGRESTKVIGYLDFVFDAGAQRVLFQRSLVGGSVALALVLFAAVVLGRRKVKQALAPLIALEEPLARLARGDLSVRMSGDGDREIVAIREALNATVAALRQREDALRQAECDALTGLVNERYFRRQLALEQHRLERDGNTSAVLCIDLDGFKDVNERFGVAAGDRLLGQVAGLLRARIREDDLLARFDGDEFIALIRGVSRDGAAKVARSINQVVHELQFMAGDDPLPVSASIGIAMLDAAQTAPDEVLVQAAAACAQAKARGGNVHHMHDHEAAEVGRETDGPAWSRQVRSAIQDDALKFVYQPILDLHGHGTEAMYELLLRFAAPGGELVSPTAFLPVADRLGMMAELDRWVVRRACEELARFVRGGRSATFFVNLSGHAFEQGDALMRLVAEELERHKLSGERLVFEITEQAAVRRLEQARVVVEGLGKIGCRFALDDFGSGFSSLNYLKHLPVAFIKIAGTFVQNVATDPLDELMVSSIVQMARALNMQTVAESVEDEAALRLVADLGVDFAQGYAVARPAEELPAPAVHHFQRVGTRRLRVARVSGTSPTRGGIRKR